MHEREESMEKPTWVKVIGVLGIIFGCTGIFGSLHMFIMPQLHHLWQDLFEAVEEEARYDPEYPAAAMERMKALWQVPDWMGTWAIVFGTLGVVVAAFYLISAIMLLQVKPGGARLMIAALVASMILAVVQAATIVTAGGFVAVIFTMAAAFSFVIDLVLLVVILTSDRTIFRLAATSAAAPAHI